MVKIINQQLRFANSLAVRAILTALPLVIRLAAKRDASVRKILARGDCTIQFRTRDSRVSRHLVFGGGGVKGYSGQTPQPDVEMVFRNAATALQMLSPTPDYSVVIDLLKNFKVVASGSDKWTVWFGRLMNAVSHVGTQYGVACADGTVRFTTVTNGGPLFVYVKDDKIVRVTPIDLSEQDAASWQLMARGKSFTPRRQSTVSPHALSIKSLVYSEKRILTPLRRVDFNPASSDRNTQNRGISEYVPISWDEALDIVASEIKRMKQTYGPGAIASAHSAHHQWGNLNYWVSAMLRFNNLVGVTRMGFSPVSWEGWYWGAMHHYGNSLRTGCPGYYGTLEDCLQNAELVVFWSSDPESTSGVYGGSEGTQRRQWARELGIEFVHIDPHYNKTAQLFGGKWIPIRPGTDAALAQAIMHEWIVNGTYDTQYVEERTVGFAEWKDHLLGVSDGVAKTPEWQESETGVLAKDVRSLAALWAKKRTYLGAGGQGAGLGGACRAANGAQWTRCMVQMMAMQGWGKPGVNFGNLQYSTPVDMNFYFPGYADGGISGDLVNSASAVHNYTRMPHILTMNTVKQVISRQHFPEAILKGSCSGYLWDGTSAENQFIPYEYPMTGYSPVHMLYRYGGSSLGTIMESGQLIDAYRHPSLEFVVSQSIWLENEVKFADIILPACTALERFDISEVANCAGYIPHNQSVLNHRMVVMQHKCIEPLGESKSDYQIFSDILTRLGLGAFYTEGGCDDLTWCKRIFNSSDLPGSISWKQFLKKGYYVIPPEPESSGVSRVEMRWFAEGRTKDTPDPSALPSQYSGDFGSGLTTQSGKFEFVPNSLQRTGEFDQDRPAINKYIPSWEGLATGDASAYPLQLITSHPPYSFHTFGDAKGGGVDDLEDHRITVNGYAYWVVRLNPSDALSRGIRHHDLVRVFNGRASVICAVDVNETVMFGVAKAFESSASYDPVQTGFGLIDRGGCLNLLTSGRRISKTSDGIAPNSCLVQVERFEYTHEEVRNER
ncbi:molybdopterin-dependent oxidoreductase [Ferribacterium limneticum]|uniref:molybdopterin-dependent oxidoreductase n=1 Tax=Ferribacterium limneticum TaxID=76259 RepID=UPI001CFA4FC2|nr:molybdopterin-dependent oxidoreductase [Ferribacterium limneticum]UCV17775.1 molybdopterin-dependent oxidoreductase [Ferribacterium limneticum]